ncbi:MAG: 5'/3'-nucleotidase SurE [Gammaproteobacteria bacterium]|jgi:5'-nucleotidase|nr:5'/3'-nucleotidase SurE [Gammaproteobacteria bacterium]
MKILLSNDDGVHAPGLTALYQRMSLRAEVVVVAPDRNRSGASNSLTLEHPLHLYSHENGHFSVDGTPTDCVHLALTGLLKEEPELVISGINAGANVADDVLYSGTVAAAMEGRFLGLPAIAVSLVCRDNRCNHFESAAIAVEQVLDRLQLHPLERETILNINVPDLPWDEIRGFRVTRLGRRHRSEPVVKMRDPRGKEVYWVGAAGKAEDGEEGTDFYAVEHGWISVTPIHTDLTRHTMLAGMEQWLQGTSKDALFQ